MSTRSGSRHHPYRRIRRTSSSRPSGRRRQHQPAATQTTDMESAVDPGGCIDLTANDTMDGDVIDLTNSSLVSANNTFDSEPVVVISPTDVDNADTFRRESSRRRFPLSVSDLSSDEDVEGVTEVDQEPAPSSSGGERSRTMRRNATITVEDLSDDDDDLPHMPFTVRSPVEENSPGSVKLTCPVCMDTDKQIRRNRQLYSTVCGHIFCSTCIKQAVDTQHMCPTCRKRLTKRQIHQIFL